jgi:hypothetical protein
MRAQQTVVPSRKACGLVRAAAELAASAVDTWTNVAIAIGLVDAQPALGAGDPEGARLLFDRTAVLAMHQGAEVEGTRA